MAVAGLWAALPAFQQMLDPVRFAMLCMALALAGGVLRLLNQRDVLL